MKYLRITVKTVTVFLFVFLSVAFGSLIYVNKTVSDYYCVNTGETLQIDSTVPVRISYANKGGQQTGKNTTTGSTFKMDVRVMGVIPVKQISVRVVDENYVAVLGTPFGIKIYTEGVLVVDFTDVETESGSINPAKDAGLMKGDFIVSLNGVKVYTNEEVSRIISNCEGETIVAKIIRDGKEKICSIKPVQEKDGPYRAGVWVKDSSAGIGTMTFYSPRYNVAAGLGHGICDSDTGTLLSVNSGELVSASIVSYVKGKSGQAGELKGSFTGKKIADLDLNSDQGVYGEVTCDVNMENMFPVALKQEVRNAKGYILTCIDGQAPEYYSCNIKVRNQDKTQNLLVEITDERLLSTTGGILQGMSGSPIIQNGKLIGAVTHVLVDDPTKGYGIFAENMLENAQKVGDGVLDVPKQEKFKEAS